jgi:hypothetical protein
VTFGVLLPRQQAEAVAARAIQQEKNLVGKILEAAASEGKT